MEYFGFNSISNISSVNTNEYRILLFPLIKEPADLYDKQPGTIVDKPIEKNELVGEYLNDYNTMFLEKAMVTNISVLVCQKHK